MSYMQELIKQKMDAIRKGEEFEFPEWIKPFYNERMELDYEGFKEECKKRGLE